MSVIQHPKNARVLCNAFVDLISRVSRPYRFRVTVAGLPPHAVVRIYEIDANSDNSAASQGIERFMKEMSTEMRILDVI